MYHEAGVEAGNLPNVINSRAPTWQGKVFGPLKAIRTRGAIPGGVFA